MQISTKKWIDSDPPYTANLQIHRPMKSLLIIFAKSPNGSNVKTRLKPLLSKAKRTLLQKALILDTLSLTQSLFAKRVLFCAPNKNDPFLLQCKKDYKVSLINQEGDDLGARMRNAFCWGFSKGFQKIVIIGSDSPTLPKSFIQEAFHQLGSLPIVLGPALDGGYYLIGMTPPIPNIFSNISWGSNHVFSETQKRLSRFYLLPYWYDVDYPKDMAFLKRHITLIKKRGADFPIETLLLTSC